MHMPLFHTNDTKTATSNIHATEQRNPKKLDLRSLSFANHPFARVRFPLHIRADRATDNSKISPSVSRPSLTLFPCLEQPTRPLIAEPDAMRDHVSDNSTSKSRAAIKPCRRLWPSRPFHVLTRSYIWMSDYTR